MFSDMARCAPIWCVVRSEQIIFIDSTHSHPAVSSLLFVHRRSGVSFKRHDTKSEISEQYAVSHKELRVFGEYICYCVILVHGEHEPWPEGLSGGGSTLKSQMLPAGLYIHGMSLDWMRRLVVFLSSACMVSTETLWLKGHASLFQNVSWHRFYWIKIKILP